MNETNHKTTLLRTWTDLDEILPKIRTKDEKATSEKSESEDCGIQYLPQVGLFGVIFGSAGSGKSVLALQLCCCFAANPDRQGRHAGKPKPRHAIYITQERPHGVRARVREFGYFQEEEKWDENRAGFTVQLEDDLFSIKPDVQDSTVTIVHMPLDPAAQEDKLRYILGFLNKTFCCDDEGDYGTDRDPKTRLLLCVDNADTISPSALQKATEQVEHPERPKRTFYKAIREYCARHRLNSWLVFEETEPQTTNDEYAFIATNEISYAADIVIRLGLTVFQTHYRERSIEIIKAKNQGYRRGRHHFSIRARGKVEGKKQNPGVVVYPSMATQLFQMSSHTSANRDREADEKHAHRLGIREVDMAVLRDNPKKNPKEAAVARDNPETKEWNGAYLSNATVSVLVSDLDSLATELALHFALQEGVTEPEGQPPVATLFLTTLHKKERLREMASLYLGLEDQFDKKLPHVEQAALAFRELDSDHVTEGKLLRDISDMIDYAWGEGRRAQRVVLDNIFKLKAKFPLIRDAEHFLNALFVMFRYKNVTALVIDTVEVGEGRNPLDQSYVAGLADHVFVLRHTESQSQPRKIFTVLKLAGYDEPGELWEIKKFEKDDRAYRAMAHDLSRSYKGILSGKLEPVSVNLSLYADPPGSPLASYLRDQADMFTRIFAHNVNYYACHPETYVAMQHSISTTGIEALGDCHVISMDEIWIEELIRAKKLVKISSDEPEEGRRKKGEMQFEQDVFNSELYVTASEDMARHFCGKPVKGSHYAIPDRNNVGVLACNPVAWERCERTTCGLPPVNLNDWKADNRGVAEWVAIPGSPTESVGTLLGWEDIVRLQNKFLSELAPRWNASRLPASLYRQWEEKDLLGAARRRQTVAGMPDWGVFTFSFDHREPAVSFFLELLLSLLEEPEQVFDGGRVDKDSEIPRTLDLESKELRGKWMDGLLLLVRLLSPWDLQRLADAWFRPCSVEMPCLFSRQWFSSAGIIGLKSPGLRIMELPRGASQKSIPVSGAWYLGILAGSTAIRAGTEIISHLASRNEEHHKVRRMIGMPVRSELFETVNAIDARRELPYREAFTEMKGRRNAFAGNAVAKIYLQTPIFYRARIKNYSDVSPLLFGAMVEAAQIALHTDFAGWMWERDKYSAVAGDIGAKIASLVEKVSIRYEEIMTRR